MSFCEQLFQKCALPFPKKRLFYPTITSSAINLLTRQIRIWVVPKDQALESGQPVVHINTSLNIT